MGGSNGGKGSSQKDLKAKKQGETSAKDNGKGSSKDDKGSKGNSQIKDLDRELVRLVDENEQLRNEYATAKSGNPLRNKELPEAAKFERVLAAVKRIEASKKSLDLMFTKLYQPFPSEELQELHHKRFEPVTNLHERVTSHNKKCMKDYKAVELASPWEERE